MFSKIIFVLLGATLVLADLESDYIEISKRQDVKAVQSYFFSLEPLSVMLQWDNFLARALYLIEVGRQKALEKASIAELDIVKKEWILVQEQATEGQYEVKTIIDSFRKEAVTKAPREWAEIAQMSIDLFEAFKKAAANGDADAMKRALNNCRRNFRTVNVNFRLYLNSKFPQ